MNNKFTAISKKRPQHQVGKSHGPLAVRKIERRNTERAIYCCVDVKVIGQYGVVLREEAFLERRFGVAYTDYKTRVSRWL
jgi:hypothetical protein